MRILTILIFTFMLAACGTNKTGNQYTQNSYSNPQPYVYNNRPVQPLVSPTNPQVNPVQKAEQGDPAHHMSAPSSAQRAHDKPRNDNDAKRICKQDPTLGGQINILNFTGPWVPEVRICHDRMSSDKECRAYYKGVVHQMYLACINSLRK